MPIARVQLEDGRIARFEVPDGTTEAEVMQAAQTLSAPQEFKEPEWLSQMRQSGVTDPTQGMSGLDKFTAGYGAAVPNLAAGIGQRLGLVDQTSIDARKRLQGPLMDTGAGFTGNLAGNVAAAVPTTAIPGANTVAGAALIGSGIGAAQPTATGESAALNTALGAVGGAAGQYGAQKLGGWLAGRAGAKAAQGAQNTVRDATLRAGQEAGYVVAPSNANPNAWNRLLQGIAGKTAAGQRAALMNQSTTNKLARQAIGLVDDTPLTPEVLAGVRQQAGDAYEVLRQFDDIALDSQYVDDVLKAAKPYTDTVAELPELASAEAKGMIQMALRERISGNGLIAATRLLRDKADMAYRAGEKQMGRLLKGISNAMEDAAERHLAQTGDEAAAEAFKGARQLIAKTYTIENSLNPGTGNVIASKLAAQVAKGKPLTGELKIAGKFAAAFPREVQEVKNSSWLQMPGTSPLDMAVGLGTSLGTGSPLGMATMAMRPAVNALLTSKPYQRLMTTPSYAPGFISRGARQALESPYGQVAGRELISNILRSNVAVQNPLNPSARY